MSKELLLQRQEHTNPLQIKEEDEEKRIIHNDIEQEIECPRCHDIIALSSDFDSYRMFAKNVTCHYYYIERREVGYESTTKPSQC